jgi:hypothetical protein
MAEYDLDVTFDENDVAPDLSKVVQDDLVAAIAQLPKNQAVGVG